MRIARLIAELRAERETLEYGSKISLNQRERLTPMTRARGKRAKVAAQGFLYSALAVARIMLVAPLLQLSLVFRYLFSLVLNPHHEVFGFLVIAGTVVSILGACIIAIDTSIILHALSIPEPLASFLRSQPGEWFVRASAHR